MSGKKFDQDKAPIVEGCIDYFPKALLAVAEVSKFGAEKYKVPFKEKNWKKLDNALTRYTNGAGRHLTQESIDGLHDPDSQMLHAAHLAWNALARLELLLDSGAQVKRLVGMAQASHQVITEGLLRSVEAELVAHPPIQGACFKCGAPPFVMHADDCGTTRSAPRAVHPPQSGLYWPR